MEKSRLAFGRRGDPLHQRVLGVRPPIEQPRGGVVGVAEIVDCVRARGPRQRTGRSSWLTLARSIRALEEGALSLREAPADA